MQYQAPGKPDREPAASRRPRRSVDVSCTALGLSKELPVPGQYVLFVVTRGVMDGPALALNDTHNSTGGLHPLARVSPAAP